MHYFIATGRGAHVCLGGGLQAQEVCYLVDNHSWTNSFSSSKQWLRSTLHSSRVQDCLVCLCKQLGMFKFWRRTWLFLSLYHKPLYHKWSKHIKKYSSSQFTINPANGAANCKRLCSLLDWICKQLASLYACMHVHTLTFPRPTSTSSWTISVPILFSLYLRQLEATSSGNLVDTNAFSSSSFLPSSSLTSCPFSSSLFPSSSFQKLMSRSRCDSLCSLLRCVLAVVASVSLRSRSHSALSHSDAARSCSALE